MLNCAPTWRCERPVCRKPMALEASSTVKCLLIGMFKCSKVINLHEFTKKSFFYSCLEKFTVYRPLWKQQKININAVQTKCHVRNVNTKMVYSIILIIDVWRTRLATKQLSNTNYNFFILLKKYGP
jgi:hypothetical protein